jgi:hypothetical protein
MLSRLDSFQHDASPLTMGHKVIATIAAQKTLYAVVHTLGLKLVHFSRATYSGLSHTSETDIDLKRSN